MIDRRSPACIKNAVLCAASTIASILLLMASAEGGTATISPDGTIGAVSWSTTGSPTPYGAVSDGSDSSFVSTSLPRTSSSIRFSLSPWTKPIHTVVTSVVVGFRHKGVSSNVRAVVLIAGQSKYTTASYSNFVKTPTTREETWISGDLTQSQIDGLEIEIQATRLDGFLQPSASVYETYLRINYNVLDQPPLANAQTVLTPQDTSVQVVLTGSDPDNDPLTFSVFTGPANGALSGVAPNLTYTPNAGFLGSDSFKFTASDGLLTSTPATVSVAILARHYHFEGEGGPGRVTVTAGTTTVTVQIQAVSSSAQIAHAVAAALSAQGVQASAIGRVLDISTNATVTSGISGVGANPLPNEPPNGFTAVQLVCDDDRRSSAAITETLLERDPATGGDPNPPPWPCQEPYRGDLQIGVGVFAHSGEFGYQETPLRVAGRGMDYEFTLTYRSSSPIMSGNLGPGWSHNWERTLARSPDGLFIAISNGFGRADMFSRPTTTAEYVDGPGLFKDLKETYPWADVRDRYGTVETFYIPNGLLDHVTDRNGNRIAIRYTANCDVRSVTDTLGRVITYNHSDVQVPGKNGGADYEERLIGVTDFTGRVATVSYALQDSSTSGQGDLLTITAPRVEPSESPFGANGFPNGKATQFTYAVPTGTSASRELKHNVLTVTEPGDSVPTIVNIYGENPAEFKFDRVIQQVYGSPNGQPSNRVSYFLYEKLTAETCKDIWVTEIDRNRHMRKYFINSAGHFLIQEDYTGNFNSAGVLTDRNGLRPAGANEGLDALIQDQIQYSTTYERNGDGLVVTMTAADGSCVRNTYYSPTPPTSSSERLKRGNRITSATTPRFGAGGSQGPIVERWTYEPLFSQVQTHTAPRGFVTTYGYDTHGNLTQVDYPGTPAAVERFTYNSFGQELTHTRPEGNVDTTDYLNGYVSRTIKDDSHPDQSTANSGSGAQPVRQQTDYVRDAVGRVTQEIDGRGFVTQTNWNALDQVWSVRTTDVPSAVDLETLTFYDARDRVVQVNRRIGNASTPDSDCPDTPFPDLGYASTSYAFDITGNPVTETSEIAPGATRVSRRRYDGNGNVIREESPEAVAGHQPGNVIETSYDEFNRPYIVTKAPGIADAASVTLDYYFTSKSVSFQLDARGFVTRHVHDGFGREIQAIDAAGGIRSTAYDSAGNVTRVAFTGDPGQALLMEERSTFDERDRKTLTTRPLFRVNGSPITTDGNHDGIVESRVSYDRESRVIATTNDNGHATSTLYDGLGRAFAVTDALSNRIDTTYDPLGNPTRVQSTERDPGGPDQIFVMQHAYDAANRRTSTTDNAGGVEQTSYDGLGLVTQTIDQEGNSVRRSYDLLSRLTRIEWTLTSSGKGPGSPDPAQGGGDGLIREDTSYDLDGRVTLRRDDNGHATAYQYSNRDQVTVETFADGTFATHSYDPNGNEYERHDPCGTVVTQSFDELNRLATVLGVPASGNPYGLIGTSVQTFDYDGLSRMVLATDNNFGGQSQSTVDYEYDSLSRVLSERQRPGNGDWTVGATFDGVGNLIALGYPSGRQLTRLFDPIERLTSIADPGTIATYAYVGPGRVKTRTFGSGISLSVGYDALRRPISWTQGALAQFAYGYDKLGNRTFERRLHEGGQGKVYRYDSAYRLLRTDEGLVDAQGNLSSPTTSENLGYDGVGNRTQRTRGATTTNYQTNVVNEYTLVGGAALLHDASGNLRDDGTFTYAYDFLNRLRTVTRKSNGTLLAQYHYDGRGRRTRDDVRGSTFVYHESHFVEERSLQGALLATYVYGNGVDELLQKVASGVTHFFHEDALGSIVAVSNVAAGLLERYRYESYGTPTFVAPSGQTLTASAIGNRHLFTGREWEPAAKLYYYRARFYSPELGRFLGRDPKGFVDGLNLYAYVLNNPVNQVDPEGLEGEDAHLIPRRGDDRAKYKNTSEGRQRALEEAHRENIEQAETDNRAAEARETNAMLRVPGGVPVVGDVTEAIAEAREGSVSGVVLALVPGKAADALKGAVKFGERLGGRVANALKKLLGIGDKAGGTLTKAEHEALQRIANEFDSTIDVVGSRGAGKGRNIETSLPVGKGAGTRSDIDVRIDGQVDIDSKGALSDALKEVGGGGIVDVRTRLPGGSQPPKIQIKPRAEK